MVDATSAIADTIQSAIGINYVMQSSNYQLLNENMSKRKLPRRELLWLTALLDKVPYSKLPINGVVLRRIILELELQHGACSLSTAVECR